MTVLPRLMLIALAMTAFLVAMVANHAQRRATGIEVELAMQTYDPRDLFLGYYSNIRTELARLRTHELDGDDVFAAGDDIYVVLSADADGLWHPVSLHRSPPEGRVFVHGMVDQSQLNDQRWVDGENAAPGDPIRERVESMQTLITARFNIERYYATHDAATQLDRQLASIDEDAPPRLIISVPSDGNAIIKGMEIDGQRRDDHM
jgi:hypothetical protein